MSLTDLGIHLTDAERCFTNIATGGDPLENGFGGIQAVLRAVTAGSPAAFPELADALATIMQQVTPIIAEAAAKWITRELTQMGMAAANALVTTPLDHPFRYDQQCYATLLSCDLAATLVRREIAQRGDPLAKMITAARAWSEHDRAEHRLQ